MILVCGIPSEPPVRMVAEAAEAIGLECLLLNPRDSARTDLRLAVGSDGTRMVHFGPGGELDLGAVTGGYVRLMDHRLLPEYRRAGGFASRDRERIDAWHAILCDWLEAAPFTVMNRLRPSNSNMSKPYQARLIAAEGLATPATLVTNRPEEARAFRARCGRVIFKSISAHRSIVQELTDERMRELDRLRVLPVQFQEMIAGDDVRVHIVDGKVFATLIRSDAVDYRYASYQGSSADYQAIDLPEEIADKCRALSRRLDLPLCGIDFKRDRGGRYVCLEVNPAPAFSSYEEQTGQPIAAAIATTLGNVSAARRRLKDHGPSHSLAEQI